MAELTPQFNDPQDLVGKRPQAAPYNDGQVTWADRGNQLLSVGAGMAGDLTSLIDRYTDSETVREWEKSFSAAQKKFAENLSPAAKEELEASLFPTEGAPSIFSTQSGLRSAITGKIVSMLPGIVPAIGAAIAAPEVAAAGVAAGVFGLQSAGAVVRSTREFIDNIADDELRNRSSEYNALRDKFDEAEARKVFTDHVLGYAPELTGIAVGLATLATGGGAAVTARGAVRGGSSEVGQGFLRGAGIGAGKSAVENSTQELAQAIGENHPLGLSGLKEPSLREIAARVGEAGAIGSLFGAVPGGFAGLRGRKGKGDIEVVPPGEPDATQKSALEALTGRSKTEQVPPPPAPPAPPVAPKVNEPTPPPKPNDTQQQNAAMQAGVDVLNGTEKPPQDAGQTNLESRSQWQLQIDDALNAENGRAAVLFPSQKADNKNGYTHMKVGEGEGLRPKLPKGMVQIPTPEGIYYVNPEKISLEDFKKARKANRLGELLGMAETTKEEVIADAQNGSPAAAITVRDGETGTAKVDALTTPDRVNADATKIAEKAGPTDTIEVRTAEQVNAERDIDKLVGQANTVLGEVSKGDNTGFGLNLIHNKANDTLILNRRADGGEMVLLSDVTKRTADEVRAAVLQGVEAAKREIDTQNMRSGLDATNDVVPKAPEAPVTKPGAKGEKAKRVAKEKAEATTAETTEPTKAVATEKVTPTGGRIFETQGGMTLEEQNAAIAANLKAVPKEKPNKGRNRTDAERAERERINKTATEIIEPLTIENTEDTSSRDPVIKAKAQKAVRDRARAMVEAAEANGITRASVQKIKDNIDASMNLNQWATLLKAAYKLANATSKNMAEAIRNFHLQERLARGGDRELMVQKMREEGDASFRKQTETKGKDGATRDAVETAEAKAAEANAHRFEEDINTAIDAKRAAEKGINPDEVVEVDNPDGKVKRVSIAEGSKRKSIELSAEDRAKVEAARKAAEEKLAAERAEKAERAERAKKAGLIGAGEKGDEVRTISWKDMTDEQKKAFMLDLIESEKRKGKISARIDGEILAAELDPSLFMNESELQAAVARAVKNAEDGLATKLRTPYGAIVRPIDAVRASDVLPRLKFNDLKGLQRVMFNMARDRFTKLAGDVPIYFVKDWDSQLWSPKSAAVYLRDQHIIIISENAITSNAAARKLIMHELAHAASARALKKARQLSSVDIRADGSYGGSGSYDFQIKSIMNVVREQIGDLDVRQFGFEKEGRVDKLYGFKNTDEFLAEAWSNANFQRMLQTIELPNELKQMLGIQTWRNATLWDGFVNTIRQLLGWPRDKVSALEGIIKVSEEVFNESDPAAKALYDARTNKVLDPLVARRERERLTADRTRRSDEDVLAMTVEEAKERAGDIYTNTKGWLANARDKVLSQTMIARDMVEGLWKGTDAPIRVAQLRRAIDTMQAEIIERIGGKALIEDHVRLEKANPEAYKRMVDIGYRYTRLDANPNGGNEHFGSDKTKYWQAKAQVGALDAEFNNLPKPYRELLTRTSEAFKSVQNEIGLKEVTNILDKLGVKDDGLAKRIHEGTATKEDFAMFKTNIAIKTLNDAQEFKKINGLYLPQMRRGDFIVSGRFEVKAPKGAIQTEPDTFVFVDKGNKAQLRRDVEAWSGQQNLKHTSTKQIWVDKNDNTKVVEAEDPNAVMAYRVRVQTQYTEFVRTRAEAQKLAETMRSQGLQNVYTEAREVSLFREKNVYSPDMDRLRTSMEKDEKFRNLDDEGKAAILQSLREAGLRMSGDNSLAHRQIFRRNVEGYSKDLVTNTKEYMAQAARYAARLENQPKIDAAFKEMAQFMEANRYESDANAQTRREQYDLLKQRIYAPEETYSGGAWDTFSRRALQASSINKLASPGFHVVNLHEVITTALPYLFGRHKGEAFGAVRRAYSMLGAGDALGRGFVDTVRSFTTDKGFTDYQAFFLDTMARRGVSNERLVRIKDMFDDLHRYGMFDREAGFEVTRVDDPTATKLGRFADRMDLTARQLGTAVEAVNRAVTGLAAYELEFKRTGNHEAAKRYAYEAVHDTMGDYSNANAAPIFRGPIGKLALQFKKFAQKQYWLLGRSLAGTLKGDPEKARQFAGMMVTHAVIAGALGLPLEPIKLALLGANALGITGHSYEDFENAVRQKAVEWLGKEGGEIATKGIYRGINIDMASRLGLDSMLTFGAPRSNKPQDWKSWLFDTMAGAPGGLILQQLEAARALADTNKSYTERGIGFAEKFAYTPKIGVDLVRAARGWEGKENARGQQVLTPYSGYEATVRALGFTPAREAEQGAMRGRVGSVSRELQEERSRFTQAWIKATPSERGKLWGRVEEFNKSLPQEARMTRAELDRAVKRRDNDLKNGALVNGMRINKNNQAVYDEAAKVYNTRN